MILNESGRVCRAFVGDEDGNEIEELRNFAIQSVSVSPRARLCAHPLENGMSRVDNKTIEPRRISVRGFLASGDTSARDAIHEMYVSRDAEFYTVVGKDATVYRNLMVVGAPSHGGQDMFDMMDCTIEFQEVMLALKGSEVTSDPGWATTQYVGGVTGT